MKKKILVIRFSSIGDIVLTSPVVRCLKEQLPNTEVHYLTKKAFAGILESNPFIDKVWALDNNLETILKEIGRLEFDYVVDLHNNLRTFFVKQRLRLPNSSFRKLNFQKWLMVNWKINRLPQKHIVERYLHTVKRLGIQNDGKGLDFFIPEQDIVSMESLPETHRQGYIAFAIGAQHATKRLPEEMILELCKKSNKPIVLLGGKEDRDMGERIASAAGKHIFNGCGVWKLNQSASIVQQAEKVISHDTGLMHIAAAFQKEILSVWGNTIPEFGMYPYQVEKNTAFEVKGLSCRPCSKIGYKECPKGHFRCMRDQNLEAIAAVVNA